MLEVKVRASDPTEPADVASLKRLIELPLPTPGDSMYIDALPSPTTAGVMLNGSPERKQAPDTLPPA
jgi:hypothetical protein